MGDDHQSSVITVSKSIFFRVSDCVDISDRSRSVTESGVLKLPTRKIGLKAATH